MSDFIEQFKKEIEGFTPSARPANTGTVVRVGDGVAEIEGLQSAVMSEMVRFDTAHGKELKDAVAAGMTVAGTGEVLSIPVGEALLGRVVSALGQPLDGLGAIASVRRNAIEREAYGVMDRQSVNQPLHTCIKAIDSMIPIGRGQRELIIGDRYTGKTTVAIDTILNQLSEPAETRPICIYVSIGQKESKTARLVAQLKEAGAMAYTIVVDAGASAPAALQYLAPFAGAAVGGDFMDARRGAPI